MCELIECEGYASLFSSRVKAQQVAIIFFTVLAILSLFIGASLILLALILGDTKNNLWMEIIKTAIGLMISGTSLATWKEVIDRRIGLIPFTNLNDRLTHCNNLTKEELEATCNLAKAFLGKF